MNIQTNFSLKKYNTFGIEAKAKQFVSVSSITELKEVLTENDDIFILGGGSNMLLTQDIEKLVVHVNLKGREIVEENDDFAIVKAQAGENWHEFVLWCIDQNFGGIENLSLIPGNVGTTPIQNIGAYGVENIVEVCGKAGSCLIEDTITLHKGVTPILRPRLLLQFEFSINTYPEVSCAVDPALQKVIV